MNKCYIQKSPAKLIFLLLICCSCFHALAQHTPAFSTQGGGHVCGHDAMHIHHMMADPDYRKSVIQMEERILARTLAHDESLEKNEEIYTIPVVFHIIHASDETLGRGTNILNSQINRGMALLNDAFRNRGVYGGDGVGANDPNNPDRDKIKSVDTNIEFVLAKQDAFGRPATGIERYASDEFTRVIYGVSDFPMKLWVAEQNGGAYPTDRYANVYLIDRICDEGGFCGNIAGYAYLANSNGQFFDGVVAEAYRFGDGMGNTSVMVHEFGHYINLRHTFWVGCQGFDCGNSDACVNEDCTQGGDFVCDTPPDNSTRGVSCGNRTNSCTTDTQSGFTVDQDDLTENYMDYGFFECWNTFTNGQKNRMRFALEEERRSIITSPGSIPITGREVGIIDLISPESYLACETQVRPIIQVRNNGTDEVTSLNIQAAVDGITSITAWTGRMLSGDSREIELNPIPLTDSGDYELNILITEVNDTLGDAYEQNNQLISDFQYEAPLRLVDACETFVSNDSMPFIVAQPSNRSVNIDVAEVFGCSEQGDFALRVNSWEENLRTNLKGEITLPNYDLNIYESPVLIFDRSYRQSYSTSHTSLRLLASGDCGASFEEVYYKAGPELATRSGFQTSLWTPSACSEWASDTIDLSRFKGEDAVSLVFEVGAANVNNTSSFQWGNNLYLDNICITESDAAASCTLDITAVKAEPPSTCEATDGSIIINASENEAVEYSLDGMNWQSSNSFFDLGSGTYIPQIRNTQILSCGAVGETITLNEPFPPTLRNVLLTAPTDCGEANGVIELIASGENGTLEYSIDGENWQLDPVFTALNAGAYTLSVRYVEEVACRVDAIRILEAPNAPEIAAVETINPATCKGIVGELTIVPAITDSIIYEYSIDAGTTWQSSATFTNLADGSYEPRIRIADKPACVGETDVVTLVGAADSNITASIEVSTDTICGGGFTRLIIAAANGRSPYEVVYTDGVEEFVAVVTFSNANVVVRPTVSTTYTLLRAKDITGCSTELSGSVDVVVRSCGEGLIINESSSTQVGNFYPNPSSTEKVTLDYTAAKSEPLQIQLFDITGKLQLSEQQILEMGANRLELSLVNIPSGTYFVKLQTADGQFVRKLVRR